MKTLFLKLAFLAIAVGAISLGVYFVYLRITHQPYDMPTHLIPNRSIEKKYQIVNVGNSHALDALNYRGYKLRSKNLAGVAQRFRFDLVMLKQYSNQIDDNAIIIIDASQISFSHRKADASDGLQYNYFGAVSPIFIPDLKISDYLQSKIVPFVRAGFLLRQTYSEMVKQRISKEEKWVEATPSPSPSPTVNPTLVAATTAPATTAKSEVSTPVSVHTSVQPTQPQPESQQPPASPISAPPTKNQKRVQLLHPSGEDYYLNVDAIQNELANPSPNDDGVYKDNMSFVFNKWYHTDEFDPKYFEGNRQDLETLIAYCLQHHWRPVVVTVPVTKILEDGLLKDYKQVYLYDNLKKTNLQGAPYIDFTDRTDLTKDTYLFNNADHMNPKGGEIFSYFLLQELIKRNYLTKDADGYDYRPMFGYQ